MKTLTMTAFAVLAAVAAVPAHAQMNKMAAMDRMFVTKVAQGNMAEVMTSRLALQKSKDEKVRMIAEMLIKEHGQSQADLQATAKTLKYKLPATTDPKHKAMYRKLSRMSGTAFDKAFLTGQVGDHYATIALFKKELASGQDSNIRNFASKYQPGIENHTKMITSTASRFNIPVAKEGEGTAMSSMKPGKAGMGNMNHGGMGTASKPSTGAAGAAGGSSATPPAGTGGGTTAPAGGGQ